MKGVGRMGKRRSLFLLVGLFIISYQLQGFCSFYDQILADTRTLALGNSYAADVNSNFAFNPSVLGKRGKTELAHTFSSIPVLELSSSFSTVRFGPVGLSYSKLLMDNVAQRQYKTQALGISIGAALSGFNLGTTLKRHEMTLDKEFEDIATTLDFAATKAIGPKMYAGVIVENLLTVGNNSSKAPAIQPKMRAGLNYRPVEILSFNLDLDSEKISYLGLEAALYKGVDARVGFNDGNWSIGCGLAGRKLSADYVYLWGGLSGEHIMTLKMVF